MRAIITRKNRPRPFRGGNEGGPAAAVARGAPPAAKIDDNLDRVLKLVPADVIAGYTALVAITDAAGGASVRYAVPSAIVLCMVLLALVLRHAGRMHDPPIDPPPLQYVFSMIAFVMWAVSVRDPLQPFGLGIPRWVPAFGCVLVPLFGSYLIELVDQRPAGGPGATRT